MIEILAVAGLLLSGVGIGMSIWALAFALKWVAFDKSQNGGNGGNRPGDEG